MTHSVLLSRVREVTLSRVMELVMPCLPRMNFYNNSMYTNIFSVLGGYGLDWNNPELYMPGKTPLVGEGLTAPHAHVLLSPISA